MQSVLGVNLTVAMARPVSQQPATKWIQVLTRARIAVVFEAIVFILDDGAWNSAFLKWSAR
jgi:hypothetical protein